MKTLIPTICLMFGLAGCGETEKKSEVPKSGTPKSDAGVKQTPKVADGTTFAIGPDNTRIVFIGTHEGPKPDPRTGGFEKFAGEISHSDGKVTAIKVSIEMDSVFSFQQALTNHLKNADFFDVRAHPTAEFVATKIDGDNVTGTLTLHGETQEIQFPAEIKVADGKVTLKAAFKIKRSEFGMSKNLDRVTDEVSLKINVGSKTDRDDILNSTGD